MRRWMERLIINWRGSRGTTELCIFELANFLAQRDEGKIRLGADVSARSFVPVGVLV